MLMNTTLMKYGRTVLDSGRIQIVLTIVNFREEQKNNPNLLPMGASHQATDVTAVPDALVSIHLEFFQNREEEAKGLAISGTLGHKLGKSLVRQGYRETETNF